MKVWAACESDMWRDAGKGGDDGRDLEGTVFGVSRCASVFFLGVRGGVDLGVRAFLSLLWFELEGLIVSFLRDAKALETNSR